MSKAERTGRRGIQSIEIGFKILDYLRTEMRPVPLKMIAANTGMSAANVHYYLVSFQAVGIVRQESDTGCYALGPYALKLGMAAIEQFDVFAVARPAMTELATTIGHTVFLGVWGNRGPTIIYRVEGGASRPIIELRVGSVLSLLRSALGRNFLAHLPRSLTGEMLDQELKEERSRETRVDDAPTTKAEVEEMMDTIRRDGISRCRDALLPNFTSLSAPIFDQGGFMIAAITMMGPIGILDDDLKGPTATALIAHARALSATAGWQPGG
ncbi:transcriptional regulator [Bradyrhizobium sp. CCBAU 11386]|nr:transcriptional regulator [Bradyrhizobium sp. CCBAU 11386]